MADSEVGTRDPCPINNQKALKSFDYKACKKDRKNHRLHGNLIFFHPDYTVGTGISPVPAKPFSFSSRTLPPIGNFTLP